MNKLLIPLFLLCLLLPSQALATQFIPYTGTIQNNTPIICVLDNSEGPKGFATTVKAVNGWADKLNHLTHSHNWNMTVSMVDRVHMTNCNITFNYTLKPYDPIQYDDVLM